MQPILPSNKSSLTNHVAVELPPLSNFTRPILPPSSFYFVLLVSGLGRPIWRPTRHAWWIHQKGIILDEIRVWIPSPEMTIWIDLDEKRDGLNSQRVRVGGRVAAVTLSMSVSCRSFFFLTWRCSVYLNSTNLVIYLFVFIFSALHLASERLKTWQLRYASYKDMVDASTRVFSISYHWFVMNQSVVVGRSGNCLDSV